MENNKEKRKSCQYITGIHALNLPTYSSSTGDWHASALAWDNVTLRNASETILGMTGIEYHERVPEYITSHYWASPERACADMLLEGKNCSDIYRLVDNKKSVIQLFNMLAFCHDKLSDIQRKSINKQMSKQYEVMWLNYKKAYRIKKGCQIYEP